MPDKPVQDPRPAAVLLGQARERLEEQFSNPRVVRLS
jgi:hypothetical protein